MTYGPYGKWLHFDDLYGEQWQITGEYIGPTCRRARPTSTSAGEVVDPEWAARRGYVVICVDSCGAGRSPGVIDIWSLTRRRMTSRNAWTGPACSAVAERQGRAGTASRTTPRTRCAAAAALQLRSHLAAIWFLWRGAADFGLADAAHHGGIFCNGFTKGWSENQVYTLQHGRGTRGFRSRMIGDWVSGLLKLG